MTKTMMVSMLYSIIIMIMLMAMTIAFINYLEGDILPDTSPWSFISSYSSTNKEMLLK
jgi:hypothetical protein